MTQILKGGKLAEHGPEVRVVQLPSNGIIEFPRKCLQFEVAGIIVDAVFRPLDKIPRNLVLGHQFKQKIVLVVQEPFLRNRLRDDRVDVTDKEVEHVHSHQHDEDRHYSFQGGSLI